MSDRELLALIPVFDAIMSEGNLSRAAERLGVTQSAVSQALARLRKLTNDPLFESHGRGVRPTPRALEIAGHARAALTHANAAFTPKTLDIASLKRTFVIDIGGGFDALLLPTLHKFLSKTAPDVRCLVSNTRGADLFSELKHGETELALDFQPTDAEGIRCERIGDDAAVVIARPEASRPEARPDQSALHASPSRHAGLDPLHGQQRRCTRTGADGTCKRKSPSRFRP